MVIIYYMLNIAVIRALSGQLALDFITLSDALFDIITICSYIEWLGACGSALAIAVSRTADSIYSAVNVA